LFIANVCPVKGVLHALDILNVLLEKSLPSGKLDHGDTVTHGNCLVYLTQQPAALVEMVVVNLQGK
jgi:hypothetical protein